MDLGPIKKRNQVSEYKWRHGFRVHKHVKQLFFPSFETL